MTKRIITLLGLDAIVVSAESTIASKPSKGSFHHPPLWRHAKCLLLIASFNDFKMKFTTWLKMARPLEKTTRVPSVYPNESVPASKTCGVPPKKWRLA